MDSRKDIRKDMEANVTFERSAKYYNLTRIFAFLLFVCERNLRWCLVPLAK